MEKDFILCELEELQNRALLRDYKTIEGAQDSCVQINGRSYLSFCSNNYLGLANHPKVKQASIEAIRQYGWGTGASRLVSGNMTLHQELEKTIAAFKGTEESILFPTGYMANLGALCALVSKGDIVIGDKLNHASIIDGCRLSGATFRIYPHKDVNQLASLLQRSSGYRRKLVVTDSVFSMDGDTAPLPEIADIARRYDAMLMVDDAHATGVFGKQGKGFIEHCGLEGKIDVVMGSLSKAIGSIGGFIAGSKPLIAFLKNKARPFIYTTALPPAVCAASLAGLTLIRDDASLIDGLWKNIHEVKSRLSKFANTPAVESPIIPLIVGSAEDAAKLSAKLYENGILIPAIRPPTVPPNTSRLRISLMATHSEDDIRRLMDLLQCIGLLTRENTGNHG
ncbi:MAG: 8-amino-7-oxononanoate synthase [Candidatus Brocadia sp.]|nr:8-amino-7-oxononanoate synthase [Anaerolineales bacterium]MCC6326813.1 8-amino-7-oxononanoate synthase [Candidatus Brocadia sp.]MCE7912561.1 8-amino-7-oxononanoate synthase [Candidatus Brocadia sp. AMX3]MDG5998125.1 8-amino-7-oxononanoate synthase [Candidatus Brocadia sp.]RIJ92858.1 MAG: 8-amino-7-oxononanoate synthase [Candidatus Brocadia sp.]